jgi:hypothetical protein
MVNATSDDTTDSKSVTQNLKKIEVQQAESATTTKTPD